MSCNKRYDNTHRPFAFVIESELHACSASEMSRSRRIEKRGSEDERDEEEKKNAQ